MEDNEVFLSVRIKRSKLTAFRNHCQDTLDRRQSDVVREMIDAIVEGRLTITPTKEMKELYK